jgi:protocatechuate 3,4-dioxygenase beta subunit
VAESWTELHEELDHLPERYRLPLVLCYLEGLTHGQAAERLDWPLGTVESRLARGREKLRRRLLRRGVTLTAALLGTGALPGSAAAAISSGWIDATARAATRLAAGEAVAAVASAPVATLTRGVLTTMFFAPWKLVLVGALAAGLAATGALAFLRAADEAREMSKDRVPEPAPRVALRPKEAPAPAPAKSITVRGRVLDPDGAPKAGAKVWLAYQSVDWTAPTSESRVRATAGADGRFEFTVGTADPEVTSALRMTSGMPGGLGAIQIVATAEGFGPGWTDLSSAKGDSELRLASDDVPISGRLVTLEGRPVFGITVRALSVTDPNNGYQLFGGAGGIFQPATTDRDGRFRMKGIGSDRTAILGIIGLPLAREFVQVTTATTSKTTNMRGISAYGAKFEHPCKPGKTITGTVRDIDTGAPVAGIYVRSYIGVDVTTTTDREGRYRLDGLSKMPTYSLRASTRDKEMPYIGSERTVDDRPGYETVTADLKVVRGVVVRGRLTDQANGQPVQAWVAYAALRDNPHWARIPGFAKALNSMAPSPGRHVPTMADGSFRLVVPPGRGFLVAHLQYQSSQFLPAGVPPKGAPGAPPDALAVTYDTVPFALWTQNYPAVLPIDIQPGAESFACEMHVDSGATRTGTVLDPEGHPLAGAAMIGRTFPNTIQFEPVDGVRFTVQALSTNPLLRRTLIFRHDDRGLGKSVQVDGKSDTPLEVKLEPLASVKGRLLDDAGKPRAEVSVRLLRALDEPTRAALNEYMPPVRVTTDRDGRFKLEGIVPGVLHTIQAFLSEQSGISAFVVQGWTAQPGEAKDLGDVTPKVLR